MDRRMMSLGRAKKKLRYLQVEDNNSCSVRIKDVFTLTNLDNIFDDIDSASDSNTLQLSPLPKRDKFVEQGRGDISPELQPSSNFGAKEPEVFASDDYILKDHLNDKESPFNEIAPIKTSSPIDLLPAGDEAEIKRPETSPLLFCVEDEEPIRGEMSKPPSSWRSLSPKEFLQDSSSLESPPAQLKFEKPAKAVSVTRLPLQAPSTQTKEPQTSAPETKEESEICGTQSLSLSVLAQEIPPVSLRKEQKFQVPEVKIDMEVKESCFQKKLRNVFQPKRIQETQMQERQKQQTCSLSPLELEDDFMIVEDDAPILFTIPRKTDSKQKVKSAPEGVSAKLCGSKVASRVESASPKLGEDEHKVGKTKTTKAKRGKNVSDTDSLDQVILEENVEPLTEAVGVCDHIPSSVPEASQDSDLPGKQVTKIKASKSDKLGKKEENNNICGKVPAEKTASEMKKPAKLTSDACNRQEDPALKQKWKPKKAKSSVKVSVPETESLNPTKLNKHGSETNSLMNKQALEEQERLDKLHDHSEPPLDPSQQSDGQSVTVATKATKQPSAKQGASKRHASVKKSKIKMLSIPKSNVSDKSPVTGKRKRKPPGEWWLSTDHQNQSNVWEEETVQQPLQKIKHSKKMKNKESPTVSTQSTEEQENPNELNQPVAVQKVSKKAKKHNATSDEKNPKIACGRRKAKAASPAQHESQSMSPAPVVGEEVTIHEDIEQLSSPVPPSSPPARQCILTPGEKRVFDKIYSRDSRCGSAQKCLPSPLHQSENIQAKRQRKPPNNWWELPKSLGSAESSSPLKSSSLKSKPQMAPLSSAFDEAASDVSSQKTVVHAQKIKQTNLINTPKAVTGSLATFDAILSSGKAGSSTGKDLEGRQKGRRNLLHSLEEQSEHSSENVHSDQQHGNNHATFDVCTDDVNLEPFATSKRRNARISAGSKAASDYDAFKSGPSSMIELAHYEHEKSDLPSRIIPCAPRVLLDCEVCGPPLQPIILENEDWDNLCVWFAHIWPSTSNDGQVYSVISPDDFHWHAYGGRAMGHMVDLQSKTFSNGKILLGSYMKKPPQKDLYAVTVFNVVSSCVQVQIDGVKTVYNSGQTFLTPCGKTYGIHNICREPAVLLYHRMLEKRTRN